MNENPLLKLSEFGQSIWLDFLRREILDNGDLQRLIENDGLRGVTSNPSIFKEAIADSDDYDDAIRRLAHKSLQPKEVYERLAVEDIQRAADLFRPVYDRTDRRDGYVSLEVAPALARDTAGSLEEARRLWKAVDRPNVFIKIPGTAEGLPAIEQAISEGININVTLLFGLPRYRKVTEAYIGGLEKRAAAGQPLDHVASVASFFLSRIDVLVDEVLDKRSRSGEIGAEVAAALKGQAAIASARQAYPIYRSAFAGERFRKLRENGARTQRLLWASTSTKNPEYSDVKYVEALIGPETVNTVPLKTLEAYRDHGDPEPRLERDMDRAAEVLRKVEELGIDMAQVAQRLENEGVSKFARPFDEMLEAIRQQLSPAHSA